MLNYRIALAQTLFNLTLGFVDGRIYLEFPRNRPVFPCITYNIISNRPAIETEPNNILVQIDVWGEDDIVIEQICDVLYNGMHNLPFAVTGGYHPLLMEINRRDGPVEDDSTSVLHRVAEYRSLLYIE